MTEIYSLATLWLGLASVATVLSIWLRIATAMSEISSWAWWRSSLHLIAAVIGSAIVPTLIANAFFLPRHLRVNAEVEATHPAPLNTVREPDSR